MVYVTSGESGPCRSTREGDKTLLGHFLPCIITSGKEHDTCMIRDPRQFTLLTRFQYVDLAVNMLVDFESAAGLLVLVSSNKVQNIVLL
jgi:hypothetical protein